ncbi:right-handed parallel beta-helix repeat-containing protein [Calditrichota bacterium]
MKKLLTIALALAFIPATILIAETINVPDDYETIQEGIDNAEDGDIVLVAEGTYRELIDFDGKNITVGSLMLDDGDPDHIAATIIDGNGNGSVVKFNHDESEDAVLYGLTVTGGYKQSTGAGMYIARSSPTITNCYITDNYAFDIGAGVYISSGSPTFAGCQFTDNLTDSDDETWSEGGAVYATASEITFNDCYFSDNQAGGGIHIYADEGSVLAVSGCEFNSYQGYIGHGATSIDIIESEADFDNCRFIDIPRGVNLVRSNATVTKSLFSGCVGTGESGMGGGIRAFDGSVVDVSYCVFEKGYAFNGGSAISAYNWRDWDDNTATVSNCTFVNAHENDGPLAININAVNCIFYNNSNPSLSNCEISYSLVEYEDEDFEGRNNIIEEDPEFVDADEGDYRLTADSPCIDTGDPDMEDPDGSRIDMGAFPFRLHDPMVLHVPDDYETIYDAFIDAVDGDTILIAQGEHDGAQLWERSAPPISVTFASNFIFTNDLEDIENTIITDEFRIQYMSHSDVEYYVIGLRFQDSFMSHGKAVQARNCLFEAERGIGASIIDAFGESSIKECIFRDNVQYGAAYAAGLSLSLLESIEITNCLFTNNSGNLGGAIAMNNCDNAIINNCTFYGNTANDTCASNIFVKNSSLELKNSIIWASQIPTLQFHFTNGDTHRVSIDHSDINAGEDGIEIWGEAYVYMWGDGNIDEDPLFVDADEGDYRLSGDSPCIDAGDPDSPPDPDGTIADMGAIPILPPDIEIKPQEVNFPPTPYGESRHTYVSIKNLGERNLEIYAVPPCLCVSAISVDLADDEREFDPPLEIAAGDEWRLGLTFTPHPDAPPQLDVLIECNDPDEPETGFTASGSAYGVDEKDLIPLEFAVTAAYPNPFNSTLKVNYDLPKAGEVAITLTDISGRQVRAIQQSKPAGRHAVSIDGEALAAGVYMVKVAAGEDVGTQKVVLVK